MNKRIAKKMLSAPVKVTMRGGLRVRFRYPAIKLIEAMRKTGRKFGSRVVSVRIGKVLATWNQTKTGGIRQSAHLFAR